MKDVRYIVEGYFSDKKKWRQRVMEPDHRTEAAARREVRRAEKYHGMKHRIVKITTTKRVVR